MKNNWISGSMSTTKDSSQKRGYSPVEESLKPILISLKIFGLYFDPTPAWNKVEDSERSSPSGKPSGILSQLSSRVYCVVVCLLLWVNVIRSIVGFFPSDDGLPYRIVITTWYFHCAVKSTIMVASCHRLVHFRSFYKHWDSLFRNSVTKQIGCGFKSTTTYVKVVIFAGWSLVILNNTLLHSLFFANLAPTRDLVVNIYRPFPETLWAKILITVMHVFETATWVFPVLYFSIVSRFIQAQFLKFKCCLSRQIDEADGQIPARLPELRSRYTLLCQAVDIFNGTYKWILGLGFFLDVFVACFISYLLINNSQDIVNILSYLFWLSGCFGMILVLSISSSHVHDAAHSLLDVLFRVGTKHATTEQLGQLNLFVAKLTGTSIGFTAIDFFVVTREFLLTLCGLYVTYFFVILQFRIV